LRRKKAVSEALLQVRRAAGVLVQQCLVEPGEKIADRLDSSTLIGYLNRYLE
jgi:hypothetical protein